MAKAFASTADLEEKKEKFVRLAEGAYCLTAEGDPNSGVVVGDDCCMVIDARATPVMARELVRHIRKVTDKPVKYVVLTHYHAVRVLGASGYKAEHVIASRPTLEMIRERGKQDWKSEVGRFPRLFRAAGTVPGLTWPTIVFDRSMTLFLGKKEVQILQPGGGGHTRGDSVVWLPKEKVLFSGDLVEEGATPYCGDAQLAEWPATLDALLALKPQKLVPGRGEAMLTAAASRKAIEGTRRFVQELLAHAKKGVKAKKDLNAVYADTYRAMAPKYGKWVIFDHCMPFCVSRAYDEAKGLAHPRIWTAARDKEMWRALQS